MFLQLLRVNKKKKLYLYLTELFKIELFICIKMDSALMTKIGWYAKKTNLKEAMQSQNFRRVCVLYSSYSTVLLYGSYSLLNVVIY